MEKSKTITIICIVFAFIIFAVFILPVLTAVVLYSLSFCFSMTGPPKEYGTGIKDKVHTASIEDTYYLTYNDSKYYPFDCYYEDSKEELQVISWSYGFPFRSAFVYKAPDAENPDYISTLHEICFKEDYNPKEDAYYIENNEAGIYLSQMYDESDSVDLSAEYSIADFDMHLAAYPELYVNVTIFKFEEIYYMSLEYGSDSYKITEEFLKILNEKDITNVS